jgi:hypothetical protein
VIYTLRDLWMTGVSTGLPDGRWVRAIPLPYYGGYLQGAWSVLTGRAVALRYPVAGELEDVLRDDRI